MNASNTRNAARETRNHKIFLSQVSVGNPTVKITNFRAKNRKIEQLNPAGKISESN